VVFRVSRSISRGERLVCSGLMLDIVLASI